MKQSIWNNDNVLKAPQEPERIIIVLPKIKVQSKYNKLSNVM